MDRRKSAPPEMLMHGGEPGGSFHRKGSHRMSGVIVLAIDGSEQAETAFDWYLTNIHRPGNSIVVVHCVDVAAISSQDSMAASTDKIRQSWNAERSRIKALEDKYRWKLIDKGISGKIKTESGKPGEVIVRISKEENAKLVVIGSRGLSKVRRTLLGSVSDYVLHHSHCPVIVCR